MTIVAGVPPFHSGETHAQRHASAARQTGGKFAHAYLMTGCWVGCMRLLGRRLVALQLERRERTNRDVVPVRIPERKLLCSSIRVPVRILFDLYRCRHNWWMANSSVLSESMDLPKSSWPGRVSGWPKSDWYHLKLAGTSLTPMIVHVRFMTFLPLNLTASIIRAPGRRQICVRKFDDCLAGRLHAVVGRSRLRGVT
jgi:hypothetical protein